MASRNGVDPANAALATSLAEHTPVLRAILAELRSDMPQVAVADFQYRQMVLDQFPAAGSKRVLVYRTGNGFDALAVPTTGVTALQANAARLGCTLVNAGANAIVLYLSDAKRAGVPAVWLSANGGAWDGRFGAMPWCGNVFAVAQTGASTLVGGEL